MDARIARGGVADRGAFAATARRDESAPAHSGARARPALLAARLAALLAVLLPLAAGCADSPPAAPIAPPVPTPEPRPGSVGGAWSPDGTRIAFVRSLGAGTAGAPGGRAP